jgi:hypothetical protein
MKHLKPVFLLFLLPFFMIGWETKEIRLTSGIQPGNLAPEMDWPELNPDNEKYVLLQFWAAYNAESRMANTQMYRTISENDEIQLLSFSMDENPAVFEGVLRADGLSRETQFNDFLGKNSPLFKQFRLQAGFGNWLINPDGVIVARNLSPEEVLDYLKGGEM